MTVLEAIQRSTEFLARKGVDSPRLQVELLLGHALKVPRLRLYLDFERQLTETETDAVRHLVKRRAAREPLQQILGSTSFCGLEIKLNRSVLIPRPETETLAEQAWTFLQMRAEHAKQVTALDFATGSGCVAIAVAQRIPTARLVAIDISPDALALARENALQHKLSERIQFLESNGFERLPSEPCFDLIVSNPPYVPSEDIANLAPEVRDFEPRLALDGGPDGLAFYRRLAGEAGRFLCPGGQIMCELGDNQAAPVQQLFAQQGWAIEATVPDLSGRPRILVARRSES